MSDLGTIVKELADIDRRLEEIGGDSLGERVDLEERRHELRAKAAEVRRQLEAGADDVAEDGRILEQAMPPR